QEEDRRQTLEELGQAAGENGRDRFLRRVYLLTDLTRSNWQSGGSLLKRELERLPGIHVFLVDVGETNPNNIAITQLRLSRQQVPTGGQLAVSALVTSTGESRDVRIELNRVRAPGEVVTHGHLQVPLAADTPQWVTFPLL